MGQFRRDLFGSTWKMRFLADNRTLVFSPGMYLGFWDAITGKAKQERDRLLDDRDTVTDMKVVTDGRLFLLRDDGTLDMWEVKD